MLGGSLKLINSKIESLIYHLRVRFTKPIWKKICSGPLSGCELYLHPQKSSVYTVMAAGTHDSFMYEYVNKFSIRNEPVIWDVGAHIGYHTLGFSNAVLSVKGKVVAFEPSPVNRKRIEENVLRNSKLSKSITIMECALTNYDGQTEFNVFNDVDAGQSSGGYISSALPPLGKNSYKKFKKIRITCARADTLVSNNSVLAPDLMKIDVEGGEYLLLQGAEKVLLAKRPVILMEVHNISMMYYVQQFLIKKNYTITIIDEKNATPSRCFILAMPNGIGECT